MMYGVFLLAQHCLLSLYLKIICLMLSVICIGCFSDNFLTLTDHHLILYVCMSFYVFLNNLLIEKQYTCLLG